MKFIYRGIVYEEESNKFFQHQKKTDTRLSRPHGHPKWQAGAEPQAGQGQKKIERITGPGSRGSTGYFEGSCGHGGQFLSTVRKDSQEVGIFIHIPAGGKDLFAQFHYCLSEKPVGIQ